MEVQSVSFSPVGNRINLKTAPSNGGPVQLAILDDRGNYLTVQGHSGTMSMDARMRQLGILKSVGATPGQIRSALVCEALGFFVKRRKK